VRRLLLGLVILVLGALVLSPAVGFLNLDPMPGDIAFQHGDLHIMIPVFYSLCASAAVALLYYFLKR
jgi:hypothetical protein